MADINNLSSFLTDVADAIRSKKNTTDLIPAANFDTEINSILTGEVVETIAVDATRIIEEDTTVKVVSAPIGETVVIPESGIAEVITDKSVLAESIGLSCEKIVAGTTILDVTGTAEVGSSEQIITQLASQVTNVRIKPSSAGTVKIQWDIPDDILYAGVDISWSRENTPSFPISETNLISIDNTTTDYAIIEGLEASTLYGFIVMSKNVQGLRNTTKTSNNTAMGYVSEMMDYIEVDVMENYTRFEKSNVVNDFIICSATSSNYPGCYKLNVTTGEWELIFETPSNFRILDPNLDTGNIILITRETSSNWPGFYYYDLTTNEMVAVNEDNDMYRIYYRSKTDNIVYLSAVGGGYSFDIDTKALTKMFSASFDAFVYDTPTYLYFKNGDYSLFKYNKNTNSTTKVGTAGAGGLYGQWTSFIAENGDTYIKAQYISGDAASEVYQNLYRVNPITGDLGSNIAVKPDSTNTIYGKLTELDNCFFFLDANNAGFYKYNITTQMIEAVPYTIKASGYYDFTRAIAYDNEYFVVASSPTIVNEDGTTSSLGVGAVMKYDKTNNTVNMVYQSSITTASQSNMHAEIYPTKTKLFMKIDNTSNMEIIMYDSVTKEISLVFSGAYQWNISTNGPDTDENEVLLLRRSSAGTSYRFNPTTNAFDIPLTDSFGTTYSSAGKYHTISGTTPITVYTSTSGTAGTYYFDNDHNLHKISNTSRYNTLLDGGYEAFLIHATANTYKYDKVSKTFSPMENVGGTQLTENSFFYKSVNQLNIYNYDGQTKSYSALDGDYTAATVTANKGCIHSTASNKLLVALTSFDANSVERNLYVTISTNGSVYHSANGIDWEYKTQIKYGTNNFNARAMCYGNNMFVVCGSSSGDSLNTGLVYTSTDGITWTQATAKDMMRADNIAFNGSSFVISAYKGIYSSASGSTWTKTKSLNDISNVVFGNGVFIALSGNAGNMSVYTSTDGTSWLSAKSFTNTHVTTIGFCKDKFIVFCGSNGNIPYYSEDGSIWTQGTLDTTRTMANTSVIYFNNMYHAYMFESADGINWVEKTETLTTPMTVVNNFVFRPITGGILTKSEDMSIWSEVSGLPTDVGNYLAISLAKYKIN